MSPKRRTPNELGSSGARVVLLGASNLTRGISTVIETARLILGGPLEVFAAMGHGRSYGMRSRVLVRSLPGIVESGLWDALDTRSEAMQTFALITDVGNDILYGAEPEQIIEWVERCIDHLGEHHARIIVTHLPMASVRRLSRWKYYAVRSALFPSCRIGIEQALESAIELDGRLRELIAGREIQSIETDRAWYGFDPIHVRMRYWRSAWNRILRRWHDEPKPIRAGRSLRRWAALRRAMPERWWLLGRERQTPQPAARLPDGTTISLF
ncbi:MAG: hypothetical protein JSV91_05670 [Phycisphaerales bacterium]|nr:MAG: hypothetical protein JSV91_05670 [Phycisphaerales bacterium]